MKYFAILKDSLREALDSKILFVLFALSTLAIVFVATISFQPLTAEQTMRQFFLGNDSLPLTFVLNLHKPEKMRDHSPTRFSDALTQCALQKVELVRGEPDAPESEYALTITYRHWPLGKEPDPQAGPKAVREVFGEAEQYGYFTITQVEPLPKENKEGPERFRVIVQGTPQTFRIWATEATLLGMVPLGSDSPALAFRLYFLTSLVLFFGSLTAILVGVVITSFFLPNMLGKGTVDLLLVKPINRPLLLFYKYIGGLTFIFLCNAYAIGGLWLVVGIRTGLWPHGGLLLILTITFFFAILYAISTFVGVLTRSIITSIMVTIVAWVCFFGIGNAHALLDNQARVERAEEARGRPVPPEKRWGDSTLAEVIGAIHTITPRTADLNQLNDIIVYTDFMTGNLADMRTFDSSKRNWWECLGVSTAWIAIFIGLAALWFSYTDY